MPSPQRGARPAPTSSPLCRDRGRRTSPAAARWCSSRSRCCPQRPASGRASPTRWARSGPGCRAWWGRWTCSQWSRGSLGSYPENTKEGGLKVSPGPGWFVLHVVCWSYQSGVVAFTGVTTANWFRCLVWQHCCLNQTPFQEQFCGSYIPLCCHHIYVSLHMNTKTCT